MPVILLPVDGLWGLTVSTGASQARENIHQNVVIMEFQIRLEVIPAKHLQVNKLRSGRNLRELISEGATGTPPVELEHEAALSVLAENFIVVAPQTDRGWEPSAVVRFLDFLLARPAGLPRIDRGRCYVTPARKSEFKNQEDVIPLFT